MPALVLESLFRLAQIAWDIQFVGIPIVFSWSSKGRLLSYGYDRESAEFFKDGFVELLQLLQSDTQLSAIHIIARSMGNHIVLDALAQNATLAEPLAEIIMAAPDVHPDKVAKLARHRLEELLEEWLFMHQP